MQINQGAVCSELPIPATCTSQMPVLDTADPDATMLWYKALCRSATHIERRREGAGQYGAAT